MFEDLKKQTKSPKSDEIVRKNLSVSWQADNACEEIIGKTAHHVMVTNAYGNDTEDKLNKNVEVVSNCG